MVRHVQTQVLKGIGASSLDPSLWGRLAAMW